MRVLVFGQDGQLGKTLKDLQPKEMKVFYSGRSDLDLSNQKKLEAYLNSLKPQIVLNASAYTSVDGAETEVEVEESAEVTASDVEHALSEALKTSEEGAI